MAVVVTLTSCPKKLRGDLTKWLFEIDTGVFVGNLNSRVRDSLWERICENIGNGRAVMAFSTNNEQKFDFRIHNSDWEAVDYDGIKLVKRLYPDFNKAVKSNVSKVEQQNISKLMQRKKKPSNSFSDYVVIDIETTGLKDNDHIIEIGAIRIKNGEILEKFSVLVKSSIKVPKDISEMTGITDGLLEKEGIELKTALEDFQEFCGNSELVGHNIRFDMKFLQIACIENGLPMMRNGTTDTMILSRRKLNCDSYKLTDVAKYLEIEYNESHRALADGLLTYRIYEKLKEI